MDAIVTSRDTKPLEDFCAGILLRHKENWPPSESALAHQFAEQLSPEMLSRPEQIAAFAKGLGIETSFTTLPDGMHGFNCSMEEQSIVLLNEQEGFPGSREHTFFHELREIMEYRFREQSFPTTSQRQELEKRAEQFAIAVRMFILTKEFAPLFDDAKAIEQTWKRVLTFVGLSILTLGAGVGYSLLPYFEKQFPIKSK